MNASVIISTYNDGELLAATIASCIQTATDLAFEVVVADDASNDGSIEEAERRFPLIQIVRHEHRRGASAAKATGAEAARGDVLVFLDAHTKPEDAALTRLVNGVASMDGEAILTPTIALLDVKRWRSDLAYSGHGAVLDLEDFNLRWLSLEHMRAVNQAGHHFYESPALAGVAVAMTRGLYDELGGFDPHLRFGGMDYRDLALKCWLLGHRIVHDPDAVVGHRFRNGDAYLPPVEHVLVSQLRLARKHFTHETWAVWVGATRDRDHGDCAEHPEGTWAYAWRQFEADLASLEHERAYLQAHRARDEFWYAEHFGLAWPRVATSPEYASPAEPGAAAGVRDAAPRAGGVRAGPSPSPSPGTVRPILTPASSVLVVPKTYTNPARTQVTLRTSGPFPRTGTLTRSSAAVRLFTSAVGGTEISFNGTDNVFSGAQLSAGVTLFAAGAQASNAVQLTLTLSPGSAPSPGPPAVATVTVVELTLDICMSRTADGTLPAPLPQPPPAPPATATDKWFGGRFVHLQDPGNHQGRALVIVRPVNPAGFNGTLVLRQVAVAANNVTGPDTKVRLFDNEFPTGGEAAKPNPVEINAGAIPAAGVQFWAEGTGLSGGLRDTGFQLGVKNVENDGDRVGMTVFRFSTLRADVPSTPPQTARNVTAGNPNGPVPNGRTTHGAGAALAAADFDIDFTTNPPLAVVQGGLPAGNLIALSVAVTPAGVPVSWAVERDTRPVPPGPPAANPNAGDAAAVIALSPNPLPTLTQDPANQLQATLADDAVGSFHVRPFADTNGNGIFDPTRNPEPFMILNVVLIRVGGLESTNSSRSQPANIGLGSFAGGTPAPGAVFAPTSTTGLRVATGNFTAPATAGIHNDATIVVIGGGNVGTRGLDRLFAGWINNELAVATSPTVPQGEDVVSGYLDGSVVPAVTHQRISIWTSTPGNPTIQPGQPAPPLVAGPVLDTTNFGNEGTGGNQAVGTEGAVGPPVPITKTARIPGVGQPQVGETWRVQMWDSPGDACPPHQGFLPGTLSSYRFNLDFRSMLCFWTNITASPAPTPGPITGAAPPTPDAACCTYASVQTNLWQIRISFTFDPGTGAGTPGPNTILLQPDAAPTRLAGPVQPHEVRAPISLNLLGTDARS